MKLTTKLNGAIVTPFLCAGTLLGLLTLIAKPHDCTGPGGEHDAACVCDVDPNPGWSLPSLPACLESQSITLLDFNHGCCGISGCQNATGCTWSILMQVDVVPGQVCDEIKFLNVTTVVTSCQSCGGDLRYSPAQPESYGCGTGTTYRIIVNSTLTQTRTVQCIMCSG